MYSILFIFYVRRVNKNQPLNPNGIAMAILKIYKIK